MGRHTATFEGTHRVIIFGFRTMVKLLATVNLVCGNCHNPAAQQVLRRMRWFTLFFIPIFPVSVSRSMTCTFCGLTSKLSKEDADRLAGGPGGPAPQQQQHGQHPPQQGWPQQQPQQQGWPQQQSAPPQPGWPPPGQQPPRPPGGYR